MIILDILDLILQTQKRKSFFLHNYLEKQWIKTKYRQNLKFEKNKKPKRVFIQTNFKSNYTQRNNKSKK